LSNIKLNNHGKTTSSTGKHQVKRKSSKLHAFSYIGGKYFLIPLLIAMIPAHVCYVEMFGGSGSFLLNKPVSEIEIYNDINSSVVNFFRVVRTQPKKLVKLLSSTPYARDEFAVCKRNHELVSTDLEKARMFYVKAQQSFSGRGNDWGISVTNNHAKVFSNKSNRLLDISARLKHVAIENRDFKFIFKHHLKNNDCFGYLDPPYVHSTRTTKNDYTYEMTDADHIELLELANQSPAKLLISGYDNPLYRKYLKGWHKKKIDVACHSAYSPNQKEKARRTEVLWWNYSLKT
jgi:DNA adenine methylase